MFRVQPPPESSDMENLGNPGKVGSVPRPNPSLVHCQVPFLFLTAHSSLRWSPAVTVRSVGDLRMCWLVGTDWMVENVDRRTDRSNRRLVIFLVLCSFKGKE